MNAGAEWVIRHPVWACLLLAGLVLLVVSRCGGGADAGHMASPGPAVVASSSIPNSSATTEPSPGRTSEPVETPAVEETVNGAAAERAATRFVQAWLAGGPSSVWLAGMERYATGDLLAGLEKTDPANVPDAHTSGNVETLVDGPALYRYRVGLDDDSAVQVEVITDGGDPLVSSIDRERE